MLGTLGLALLALLRAVGPSQASGFTEKGLSLLGYQLCNYSVTQNVQKVEAVQLSQATYAPCGGWIPWRRCPKTVYRTRYLAVDVPASRNVTDCCEGYEQLGLYCVLPLNRSSEFASRPGVCPTVGPEAPTSPCTLDADCPGLQKCCPWSGGHRCMVPAPQGRTEIPARSWYNVTSLVKMDFRELRQVDPSLLHHMRLLHSMVTGALRPMEATVYHLHSACGDTSTTVSQLLLGLPRPVPVANVSAMLDGVVKRIYEVVSLQVQDLNECSHEELNACAEGELCLNLEGSYQCVSHPESLTSSPQKPNCTCEDCDPLIVEDYMALSVTSSSFQVSWSFNSTRKRTFHVQVYRGEELLRSAWTQGTTLDVAGLEAGVLYGVRTSYQACGTNVTARLTVKTDARVFEVTVTILNHSVAETLLSPGSLEHQRFSERLLHEVQGSLPPAVSDLYRRGKLRLQIVSLQAGGLVVKLKVTVQDPEFPVGVSTLAPMLPLLWASREFQIDQQGTLVQDWDECADGLEHDCSAAAQCINLEGSYTCRCLTARDANPSRAGRACAGDMVSPTGDALAPMMEVTVPALSTEPAAPGPESPTSSPSPEHLRGLPAASQAQTPEAQPRTGGSSMVGQDRNGTGQDTEEGVHGNSTTEPPARPTPAEGPTGHTMWQASLPTWGTLPAPLEPTRPQDADPGPSGSPDLPLAPSPMSPEIPACVPAPVGKVTVSNVTGTGFHVAWAADLALRPTFQLTLTTTRRPAVRLQTRNASLALWGLEPGVLHRVDIVAKACGKESASTRLRVRTAARKLSGQVRITNVRYSEAFADTSSKEAQGFLELFFRVVRDSLPATMRQHLDTGGVQVEVARIANGSVVVEFHLLIVLDVGKIEMPPVSGALQDGPPLLPCDDYDECARREDDCEPGSSCLNTLGSFTCRCVGGTSDLPVEYSGRPCEGDSSDNTTQAPRSSLAPGLEQSPSPAETRAASPAPQGVLPRLSLAGAVRVLCEIEKVAIAVQRRFLQQESIPESSLYLGQPSCGVSDSNSTHVFLAAGWSECGTLVQSNMTDTVVRTTLRNDLSPDGIVHHLKILSPIRCAFRNDLLTSSGYMPEWGVYTIIEDLHGAGSFVTEMQLFIGDAPIPRNYSVSASDDVKIEVGLSTRKSNLKVVLTECWATPSSDALDPVMFGFINNSCPIPNTHTCVIENGSSSKAQFKLKIFSFINSSRVYLHCRLRVCMEAPGSSCRINCEDFRSLRSGEPPATHLTSWGPLVRSDGEPPAAKPGLAPSSVVLIVVAVFALVTGAAALVIARYQRVTGKYNCKAQADDFSYQVFYD
ncbi:uromodulin-like 1 [Pteropus alecto]|uniref:uromodulin-like 1 n=1 Tax=Pteropus alecto TaxID=9402 RepID=UPI0003F1288A|nr:uromodulin-like 1 [Pteropus alecto]